MHSPGSQAVELVAAEGPRTCCDYAVRGMLLWFGRVILRNNPVIGHTIGYQRVIPGE